MSTLLERESSGELSVVPIEDLVNVNDIRRQAYQLVRLDKLRSEDAEDWMQELCLSLLQHCGQYCSRTRYSKAKEYAIADAWRAIIGDGDCDDMPDDMPDDADSAFEPGREYRLAIYLETVAKRQAMVAEMQECGFPHLASIAADYPGQCAAIYSFAMAVL